MAKNSRNFIVKITKRQLKKLIEATITLSPDDVEKIEADKDKSKDKISDEIAKESGLSQDDVEAAIDAQDDTQNEALEKLPIYKKYSYGLDDIPDAGKAEDDIIGHT